MKIFVTGFHRSGTHTAALELAKKHKVSYIEESRLGVMNDSSLLCAKDIARGYFPRWVDGEYKPVRDLNLDKGFILHCPFLAHRVPELSELGTVYWCDSDEKDIANSLHSQDMHHVSLQVMRQFRDIFPDDKMWPIWKEEYRVKGEPDPHGVFVNHYLMLVKMKRYFYDKYFSGLATLIKLEEQSWYKPELRKAIKLKVLERI